MKRRNIELEPWMAAIPLGVIAIGGVAYAITSLLVGGGKLPDDVPPPHKFKGVPFAAGIHSPAFPLQSSNPKFGIVSYRDVAGEYHGNWSRRFGAPRDERNHAGIDLYANAGDPVLAMGDGVVVATQTFHLGSYAIFVNHGDTTVMYGEIAPKSWQEFGLSTGARVKKGQPIARVDCMVWEGNRCRSHMLHLETYVSGTTKNRRWYRSNQAPKSLLDPTMLLLLASPRPIQRKKLV